MAKRILFSITLIVILSLVVTAQAAAQSTMRLDYYHTGNASLEMFSVDRVVVEPLQWPGNPQKNIDETNLGKYFFEVRDRANNRLLYSRGFASIYGEWETTDEAKNVNRTFHESLRFPAPQAPVQIVLKKRDANNAFREMWSTIVDPKDMFVDTSKPASPGPADRDSKERRSCDKVDFLIIGDGYTAAERGKFESRTRAGWSTFCSRPRPTRSIEGTSTCGGCARPPKSPGSRGHRPGFIEPRRWAQVTTHSVLSDTF